ncbi:uncharacterized protein ACMZJ9_019874 [Mantella aurantiaca]
MGMSNVVKMCVCSLNNEELKGVAVALCQPHKLIYVPSGGSLNISCSVSNYSPNSTRTFFWFRRTWRDPVLLEKVINCKSNSSEYICMQDQIPPVLEIQNISILDSGVYYCAYFQKNYIIFGNGASLITGDNPRFNSHVMLAAPLPQPSSITNQLGCAVNVNCNITQWTWNVSGICHKGKIICRENHIGSWTCVNLISLSRNYSWNYGDIVTCDVWCDSSFSIQVKWRIQKKAEFSTTCQYWLVSALTLGLLLLLSCIAHLTWTYRRIKPCSDHRLMFIYFLIAGNEIWDTDENDSDPIAYAELNAHRLTTGRRKINS